MHDYVTRVCGESVGAVFAALADIDTGEARRRLTLKEETHDYLSKNFPGVAKDFYSHAYANEDIVCGDCGELRTMKLEGGFLECFRCEVIGAVPFALDEGQGDVVFGDILDGIVADAVPVASQALGGEGNGTDNLEAGNVADAVPVEPQPLNAVFGGPLAGIPIDEPVRPAWYDQFWTGVPVEENQKELFRKTLRINEVNRRKGAFLRIPKAFGAFFEGKNSIEFTHGVDRKQEVRVHRDQEDVYRLKGGWSTLVGENHLDVGNEVIFRLDRDGNFYLEFQQD